MTYTAKIFLNETQVSLNLIFNDLQLERFFHNLEKGDIVKYLGDASSAEETAELMGLSQLRDSDRELYFYISATFISLATMTNETDIYRKTLQHILSDNMEQDGRVLSIKEFIENSLEKVDYLYHNFDIENKKNDI
jgi:hypothetical protein